MVPSPAFSRLAAGLALLLATAASIRAEVLRPRVVVVTMFEMGADTGDTPGELQYWVEREKLDRIISLPAAYHDVRANADGSVIAIVTGMGNSNAAASIMALGLDPRFDLSQSYWLVAGIAGLDPADASVGSAAWADYVVEGDLGHEIDAREIPADWKTGYVPLRKKKPYEQPMLPAAERVDSCYAINPGLLHWAFALTRDTPLVETADTIAFRNRYSDHPKARQSPSVLIGSNLASSTYWHGKLLDAWANDWVALLHGRPRQLRDHRHGRHRHAARADQPHQGRPRRCAARPRVAHRQQFRPAAARPQPPPRAWPARKSATTQPTFPPLRPLTASAAASSTNW